MLLASKLIRREKAISYHNILERKKKMQDSEIEGDKESLCLSTVKELSSF